MFIRRRRGLRFRSCEDARGIPVAERGLCFGDVEGARRHAEKYHAELEFVPRPDARVEEQRMHCVEMMKITRPGWPSGKALPDEGVHAWYVQGNQITFQGGEDEPMDYRPIERRYWVRWGCAENPVWDGDEGSGKGEGFIESLRDGDCILLWARVKVSQYYCLLPMCRENPDLGARDRAGKTMSTGLGFQSNSQCTMIMYGGVSTMKRTYGKIPRGILGLILDK